MKFNLILTYGVGKTNQSCGRLLAEKNNAKNNIASLQCFPISYSIQSYALAGIFALKRLLPFDRRFGRDVSSTLVLSVLKIIAPYKLRPIFFSSVRLPSSALFHSSRCEAVFGYGVKFRESTGIMSNLSINVIIRRCFDILIHCSVTLFTIFQLKIVKHNFFLQW